MARLVSPAAEALLDVELPVLDQGKVVLIDYMGTDSRIADAARTSYGEGTRAVSDDNALIRYLMRHLHTTPFEHVIITYFMALPLFVQAQLIRHRTASVSQYSGRYSLMPEVYYYPPDERLAEQSKDNKQGSGAMLPAATRAQVRKRIAKAVTTARHAYDDNITAGLSREMARQILPQNQYTYLYWTCDLHNIFHFLFLRLDTHAQWEIRVYAEAMAKIAQAVAPHAYAAFEDYRQHAHRLSRGAWLALADYMNGEDRWDPWRMAMSTIGHIEGVREKREFLAEVGIDLAWLEREAVERLAGDPDPLALDKFDVQFGFKRGRG